MSTTLFQFIISFFFFLHGILISNPVRNLHTNIKDSFRTITNSQAYKTHLEDSHFSKLLKFCFLFFYFFSLLQNKTMNATIQTFNGTKKECQDFISQFKGIPDDVKLTLPEIWFTEIKRGEAPEMALLITLNNTLEHRYIKAVKANEILEAFGKLINKSIELFNSDIDKQVKITYDNKAISAFFDSIDYDKMDYNEWKKKYEEEGKGVVIESPDVDFSESIKKVPSEIRNKNNQCDYKTFELCEKEINDDNRDYFYMFDWNYSPKQNIEYKKKLAEANKRMYSTETPEELIKETIDYRKTHQYILTVPRINSKKNYTRVVRTEKLDAVTIKKMAIHRGSKVFYEAINEVLCPQLIAVHPYVDFDFDFEGMTEDEEKQEFVKGIFEWLDSLEPVFGKYCAGGYTKMKCFADEYFPYGYSLYNGIGHQLSLHVIFYEKAILVSDLIELFKVSNNNPQYTKGVHENVDRNVYEVNTRRVLRHILSPKLSLSKETRKPEDRLYNGCYLKDHEPKHPCDSFVALSGNETPVSDDLLYEFFGFRHANHIPKVVPKSSSKSSFKSSSKSSFKSTTCLKTVKKESEEPEEFDDGERNTEWHEEVVKVILPKEYMRKLFDLLPWCRYGDFLYKSENPLHKALKAFIANSPYSYDDTLELLESWWLREPHHNHDNQMSIMMEADYYDKKTGIHDQHNNCYYEGFYHYIRSLIPKREVIEDEVCKEYNLPNEVYTLYKTEINKKYETCKKNKNLARSYYPYIKNLEQEASKIDKLPKYQKDDYTDLTGTSDVSQYDWLPEIIKVAHPENDEKIKVKESVRFKFHVTMFKLDTIIKEKSAESNDKREALDKIKFEFGKRIMAMNVSPSEGGYFYYRYNNYKDEGTKKLMTINYDPRQGFVNPTSVPTLEFFYHNHPFDATKIWITSLRELQKLMREQKLLSVYSVSDSDPRTEDARRFIEIVKKTFRRPIDAKAYFEFLRKKLEEPTRKLDYNLCCYGASGVFKTALTNILGAFLTTKILSMTDVQNKFNQWIIDTSLSIVEEIGQQEENASDKAEALKRILNWNVNVEVKNGPHIDVDSCMNMIMNCNFDSIGGLMDYRTTDDMNRRFIMMPRIRPDNWKDDLKWGSSYISDKKNWRFITAMILREPYLTDEEREELMKYQEEEEYPRFKTAVGKRSVLFYDEVKVNLIYVDSELARSKKCRSNSYCLNISELSKKLQVNKDYNAGGLTERALLLSLGVLDHTSQSYNYVTDVVKLYFTYVKRDTPKATKMLLDRLKEDYPGCEESETYKSELEKLNKEPCMNSVVDMLQENPEMDD